MAFHLGPERIIFPALCIAPDEKVVAAALPKVATCLKVLEDDLTANGDHVVGGELSLTDFIPAALSHHAQPHARRRRDAGG